MSFYINLSSLAYLDHKPTDIRHCPNIIRKINIKNIYNRMLEKSFSAVFTQKFIKQTNKKRNRTGY